MAGKTNVHVTAEPTRNLLRLTFAGKVGLAEVEPLTDAIEAALAGLPRGFLLLTDLSGLESMAIECLPYIKGTMDQCRGHGVARIVRVIPDRRKDIGFNILSLFHYPHGLQILTCDTMAEAERALE